MTKEERDKILAANPIDDYLRRRGINLKKAGAELSCCCPFHDDSTPSLFVNLKKRVWRCHGCNRGGSVIDLHMAFEGCPEGKAMEFFNPAKSGNTAVAEYDYSNEEGHLLYQVVRELTPEGKKTFNQRHKGPNGEWVWNIKGVRRVPYHLDELVKPGPLFRVIAEGEKDVDILRSLNLCATCNSGGAEKWDPEFSSKYLTGQDVVVFYDRDEPGIRHARKVAESLLGHARSVRIAELPEGFKDVGEVKEKQPDKFEDIIDMALREAKPFGADFHWHGNNGDEEPKAGKPKDGLPEIQDSFDLCEEPDDTPPEIVEGVFHQGSKVMLAGGSKSFKTWQLLQLAVCVSAGQQWLKFNTTKRRVLFLNFELPRWSIRRRIREIRFALGILPERGALDVWNLRGHAASGKAILPKIAKIAAERGYGLIVLDPLYKLLGDRDENAATDMSALMNEVEQITVATLAAIAFGTHFSKGNQAAKEAIDRMSGSGVLARDPDSILVSTDHAEENAFTVSMILRNLPGQDDFVMRFKSPLMTVDDDLNPEDLKRPKRARPGGGQFGEEYTEDQILEVMDLTEPKKACVIQRESKDEHGMSEREFYRIWKTLKKAGKITEIKGRGWCKIV